MTNTASQSKAAPHPNIVVRTYQPQDQQAVEHLYTHGLLAGQIADNDTGADIDNIRQAYLEEPNHNFWVALMDEKIVGMVAVGSDEDHTAEVRRLRVDEKYRNNEIPSLLLKTAVDHCKKNGYLKVRLDTRFEPNAAMDLFHKIGFEHSRTKNVHGKELLEFYLDIYRQPENE